MHRAWIKYYSGQNDVNIIFHPLQWLFSLCERCHFLGGRAESHSINDLAARASKLTVFLKFNFIKYCGNGTLPNFAFLVINAESQGKTTWKLVTVCLSGFPLASAEAVNLTVKSIQASQHTQWASNVTYTHHEILVYIKLYCKFFSGK